MFINKRIKYFQFSSKVNNMCYMFHYCSSLIELNISNINTSKVNNISDVFDYFSSLKVLNI